jgi:hypothetical protein
MGRPELGGGADLERRLRETLAAKAARAEISPGAWSGVERRIRRRRRGRLALAVAVVGLLLAAIAVVPLTRMLGGGPDPVPPATRTVVPAPTSTVPPATVRSAPDPAEPVDDPAAALAAIGQSVGGEPWRAVSWTDANGGNLFVLSSSQSGRTPAYAVSLEADLFATKDGRTTRLRRVTDGVTGCATPQATQFDGEIEFDDHDRDGVGEVLFSYATGCVADTAPVAMKLLVLEGADKYIARGQTRYDITGGAGGEDGGGLDGPIPEPAWPSWPSGTREWAEAQWEIRTSR